MATTPQQTRYKYYDEATEASKLTTADELTVAKNVDVKTGLVGQTRGLIGRFNAPSSYAVVMPYRSKRMIELHSFGVPYPYTVLALDRYNMVKRKSYLEPPWDTVSIEACCVVELPGFRDSPLDDIVGVGDNLRFV